MEVRTLAFEIGTEEIPAFDLVNAEKQLASLVPTLFKGASIPYNEVSLYSTPRRLVVVVSGIPSHTEEKNELFKGPAAAIAFDDAGAPTKAACGFARGKKVDPSELFVQDGYVYARTCTPSVEVATLLPAVLDGIVRGISWPRSQRWGTHRELFSRPIRWLVALFGEEVIPFEFAGVSAGRMTQGHRFLAPQKRVVTGADALIDELRSAYVVPSAAERESIIKKGVADIEAATGFHAVLPAKTLVEVVNLAEYPTVLAGTFDEEFLEVPEEIIVDAMLMHQRYFPLYNNEGKLTNRFIIVSNGNPSFSQDIAEGNGRVVRARLFDAKFFYEEDLKTPLESYVSRLSEVVFQEKLGSVLDKTKRIETLARHVAHSAGLPEDQVRLAARAAYLCKADLVSSAVVEFTSVQGVMGSYYAQASGEAPEVSLAIAEHYKPRFAGDDLPEGAISRSVALADKLDTICGLFCIGQEPTGSSDPFALRRAAIGIIAMLFDTTSQAEHGEPLDISLVSAIRQALCLFADQGIVFDAEAVCANVVDFFVTRTKVIAKEAGYTPDAIEAVLAAKVLEPAEIMRRVAALDTARKGSAETFDDLATAFARANNLRDASLGCEVDSALLVPVETQLLQALTDVESAVPALLTSDDYAGALQCLASLREPIDAFFAEVMVMDEDSALRNNRLRILNRFVAIFTDVADFSQLSR